MPFKTLSNALLNPYKEPFKNRIYNYLITKNLRRLLNNSFLTHFPTFSLHILSIYFEGWWTVGAGWWVLMVSIKFIVNPHIINNQHSTPIPQHSIPHIINTQHSSPNTQHSIPHIIITHHSSPNIQPHTSSTPITQHPSPNIQSHTSSTPNTQHPTFPTPLIS